MKTIEALKNIDRAAFASLIDTLNIDHIVSDEDDKGLSSSMIERWSEDCEKYLRDNGYNGGKLSTDGRYFPKYGAVYCIYDERQVSVEEVSTYLRIVAIRGNSGTSMNIPVT